jgi:hypothetical protein
MLRAATMEHAPMPRERLPDRRASENFNFTWNQIPFVATISRYPDHRLGEIFLASNKAGSHLDAAVRDSAVLCWLCNTARPATLSAARSCARLMAHPARRSPSPSMKSPSKNRR